jgi:hypothetical protein
VSFVVCWFFLFFLSSLARVSASHAAFTFPRDAGRLLFHSKDQTLNTRSAIGQKGAPNGCCVCLGIGA